MFGPINPKVRPPRAADSTLLWSARGLALNKADSITWTGTHSFQSSVTCNGSFSANNTATFASSVLFLSATYLYYWPEGSLPYIGTSGLLSYDTDDYYRHPTQKRYGYGIGYGDTLQAKVNIVGQYSCSGTATECADLTDDGETLCNGQLGCSWYVNGYCSGYSYDQYYCESQQGCDWNPGTDCSEFNDNKSGCETYPGECSWSGNTQACSTLTGSGQYACDYGGGGNYQQYCYWQTNTCGTYYDQGSCDGAPPCQWTGSNCSDFDDNYYGCTGQSPCVWSGGMVDCSTYDGTDQMTCEAYTGCVWNSGASECQGSCSGIYNGYCGGDNSYCADQGYGYPDGTGTCSGYYGTGCIEAPECTGTATVCTGLGETDCGNQDGCTWGQEPSAYFDGKINAANWPTSSAGLSSGDVWNDSGTLKIVP